MTPEEREALLVPGTRGYKQPIDVKVEKVEKQTTVLPDGSQEHRLTLHYDHPYVWHDGGHRHHVPLAALADRAVQYGLDPKSPTFLADVLEHIVYERHHPDALAHPQGLLPQGVTPAIRQTFGVDKTAIAQAAAPHVDLAAVAEHAAALAFTPAFADLPPWLRPGAPNLEPERTPPTDEDLLRLSPAELLARPKSG